MNIQRRWFLYTTAAAISGSALSKTILSSAFAQQIGEGQPAHVNFGWQRGIQLPYQAIRILDLGKRANLSVDWTRFDAGPAMLPALQSGSIDMAQMGASPALVGIANGLDISIVGIVQNIAGGEGLVVQNSLGINNVADLAGKRIGIVVGSSAHGGLIAALEKSSLKISDVSLVNIGPSQMLPAFENKDLDAVYIWDPYMSFAINMGGKLIMTSADVGDLGSFTASHGLWVARNDFLRDQAASVQRFMQVADLGLRSYLEGGDEKAAIASKLASELNVTPDIVQDMIERVVFPSPADQLDIANNYAFAAKKSSSSMRIVESLVALSELQVQFGNLKKSMSADEISAHVDASVLNALEKAPRLEVGDINNAKK